MRWLIHILDQGSRKLKERDQLKGMHKVIDAKRRLPEAAEFGLGCLKGSKVDDLYGVVAALSEGPYVRILKLAKEGIKNRRQSTDVVPLMVGLINHTTLPAGVTFSPQRTELPGAAYCNAIVFTK